MTEALLLSALLGLAGGAAGGWIAARRAPSKSLRDVAQTLQDEFSQAIEKRLEQHQDHLDDWARQVGRSLDGTLEDIEGAASRALKHKRAAAAGHARQARSNGQQRPYQDEATYLAHLEAGGGVDPDFEQQMGW